VTSAGLVVQDVVVRYGGVRPLDGVSLEFAGGVCGIVGPNGAGKTTFFNVLSGFARVAEGAVRFDGIDLLAMSPARRARWGLRRTFQQEQVIQELSGEDNVLLTAEHTGAGRDDVRTALDFVGLERPHRAGSRLTMLERRLVEFAKAIVGTPRIVLLDEPAAGLSSAETQRLATLITAMPDTFGVLVVLVDHDMDLVSAVCRSVAVLDFGKRIALGPTAEVLASEQVKRAYLGTADVEQA